MSVETLRSEVAEKVLSAPVPARLAFTSSGGRPNVTPIWFLWRDQRLVMCSQAGAFKVRAIREHPYVAVSIDRETPPYESVRIRGPVEIEVVDGIAPDYVTCAHHYYGAEKGQAWIDFLTPVTRQMAVLSVTPEWAEVWDFRERFPDIFGD